MKSLLKAEPMDSDSDSPFNYSWPSFPKMRMRRKMGKKGKGIASRVTFSRLLPPHPLSWHEGRQGHSPQTLWERKFLSPDCGFVSADF